MHYGASLHGINCLSKERNLQQFADSLIYPGLFVKVGSEAAQTDMGTSAAGAF
jgi:hypothetical protein